jgi:prepilin-type N-terminal cleavage/methylation domain-containing protein
MLRRGFTLIEVLTTITIIGILVGITVMTYGSSLQRSRDGQRKVDQDTIKNALEQFYLDHRYFPAATAGANNIYNSRWQLEPNTVSGCDQPTNSLTPLFIATIPEDPQNQLPQTAECAQLSGANQNGQYLYFANPKNSHNPQSGYLLLAKLERNVDKNIDPSIATLIQGWGYNISGLEFSTGRAATHNYVVTSAINN